MEILPYSTQNILILILAEDNMKEYLKNNLIEYLSKQKTTIYSTNNSIMFKIGKSLPFFHNNLIIKHRASGKRISKKIKNKKVELFSDEIPSLLELANITNIDNLVKNLDKNEVFDIYFKYRFMGFEYVSRAPSPIINKTISLVSEKNKAIFKAFPTIGSNLSFFLLKSLFSQKIESLKNKDNYILLKGSLKLFENFEFDEVEICAENKETFEKRYFKCIYKKNRKIINFKAKIDFQIRSMDLNSYWKLSIRVKNNGLIIDESFLDGDILNNKAPDKKRLLIKTITFSGEKKEEPMKISLYLYLLNNYLRLRISTEEKRLDVLNKEKNKILYDKYREEEKIDQRKIFFESFHGNSYSHNPKYIYEKMLQMGYDKKYRFVWSYTGKLDIPGNPKIVNRNNNNYYKELASSKYLVNNISFPISKKRKESIYIQTTHGTPLKLMGEDIKNESQDTVTGKIVSEAKEWDYLISPNQYSHEIFRRAFKFDKDIIDSGYPANDIFYIENDKKISKIKKDLKINSDKKIILYAPTFRDTERDLNRNFSFNLPLNLKKIYEKFNDDYIILLRLHYLISSNIKVDDKLKKFAHDVSNYDDIHELLLISDILITDYSSVFFDYAHTKNPILFFMPDLKDYDDNIRGLYLDIKKDLPGPIFMNEDELINGVKNISMIKEDFEERYEKFYNRFCNLGHGNASEELIKNVFEGKNDSKP